MGIWTGKWSGAKQSEARLQALEPTLPLTAHAGTGWVGVANGYGGASPTATSSSACQSSQSLPPAETPTPTENKSGD